MARADLLKKLFRNYKENNALGFMQIAEEIIAEERKKNHSILADEIQRILNNSFNNSKKHKTLHMLETHPTPTDTDRKVPLIEVKYPDRLFKDLVMHDVQKEALEIAIRDYRNWEVLESNGLVPCHKILFCGPPGCGKTVSAEAIAGELGIPLLYIRFDAIVSSLLGETSMNLRKVFDYAQDGSWVIFFDEFDAIGRSRDDITEHGEIKRVVNAFLQLLDNFHGKSLIVAATNYEKSLDFALWRRFDEIVRFDLPSQEHIIVLLRLFLSRLHGPIHVLEEFSNTLVGLSHAEIERICMEVLKNCVIEGRLSYQRIDIEKAVRRAMRRAQISKGCKDKELFKW